MKIFDKIMEGVYYETVIAIFWIDRIDIIFSLYELHKVCTELVVRSNNYSATLC